MFLYITSYAPQPDVYEGIAPIILEENLALPVPSPSPFEEESTITNTVFEMINGMMREIRHDSAPDVIITSDDFNEKKLLQNENDYLKQYIQYLSNYIIMMQSEYADTLFQLFVWFLFINFILICCLRSRQQKKKSQPIIVNSEPVVLETKI